ncbi:tetratricopeptide (TPR) repeat protein [Lewinella marina]|uniref:Tetratricopeptide repeat protein n=1 Tax=Neolewinella marina TaxID=438751 RepID=A0A2G0CKA8_9BACT|nr:tetratricopeptide repeat protein [Neolewinella marina]NJB84430.1 tetratricopeptide (TPR) repeat protein [Neolewinella marina]PHL00378.1 hypothetical protein CGL56_04910 [Neolewinella marina]
MTPTELPEAWAAEIEAYYAGELSPAAEADLRQRLAHHPELAELVFREEVLYRDGLNPGPAALAERQRLRQNLGELERNLPPVMAPAHRRRPPVRWLAVAAGLLLVVLAWWLLRPAEDPTARLATEAFAWLPRQDALLGPGDEVRDGRTLYDVQRFEEAYPALREEVASGTIDSINLLYAGVAALGAKEPAAARELLTNLLQSGRYPEDEAAIRYYLGLAELQLGNRAAAVEQLNALPDQDPQLTQRARELLQRLESLE